VFVKDPETGVILAAKYDFITDRGDGCDIKTTRDASVHHFKSAILSEYSTFYILQAAHYAHVLKVAGIGRGDRFTFVAIEKTPPYEIAVYTLDEGHLAIGEEWRKHLTNVYAECLETGQWAGYPDKAQSFDIPNYASMPPEE
jgi:hypothetical protein